jgi:hypothetical protein
MLERKEELEEEKGREGKGILELEEKERVTDEISMAFWLKRVWESFWMVGEGG